MRDLVYLTFDQFGVKSMRKSTPSLHAGEYAVAVKINVPESVFKRAFPLATIDVPEGAVIVPTVEVVVE